MEINLVTIESRYSAIGLDIQATVFEIERSTGPEREHFKRVLRKLLDDQDVLSAMLEEALSLPRD